jgi:hypothetical protein
MLWCADATQVHAHGTVGRREFIEPFVTEDANVKNEAVFQGIYIDRRDPVDRWEMRYEIEKTLSARTSIFFEHGAAFHVLEGTGDHHADETAEPHPHEGEEEGHGHEEGAEPGMAESRRTHSGFGSMGIGLKRELYRNAGHEALLSVAAAIEAPTGSEEAGAEDHAAAEFLALGAKGFGDLPERLGWLRPFAIQADTRLETPLGTGRPENELSANAALQYHLKVLREHVNFPEVLENLVLVTEFSVRTRLNGPSRAETDSFVIPGLVYKTRRFQVGVAVRTPLDGDSDEPFAVLPTVAIFYDEIIPALGRNPF